MSKKMLTAFTLSAMATLSVGQVQAQRSTPTARTAQTARSARSARSAPTSRTSSGRRSSFGGRSSSSSYFGSGGRRAQQSGSFSNLRTPSRRPTVSPYLNLLRGNGRSTAFNYYNRVRPENEFRNATQQLDQSLQGLQKQISDQQQYLQNQASGLTPSGHKTSFLNTGSYFP